MKNVIPIILTALAYLGVYYTIMSHESDKWMVLLLALIVAAIFHFFAKKFLPWSYIFSQRTQSDHTDE